jgi:hypothetical protein
MSTDELRTAAIEAAERKFAAALSLALTDLRWRRPTEYQVTTQEAVAVFESVWPVVVDELNRVAAGTASRIAREFEDADPLSVVGYTWFEFLPWAAAIARRVGETS